MKVKRFTIGIIVLIFALSSNLLKGMAKMDLNEEPPAEVSSGSYICNT